jgi:sterol desaturase/sphingolipid hydroxylase (fatty acid hydroxylase superfamily)
LAEWPILAAVVAFIGGEFLYYWFHRASHRISVLWASHVVHHQSPLFNASVSVRQGWLEGTCRWPSNVPLAVIGVPPETLLAYISLSLMYQVWLHTRSIGPLPWLEGVLNTPSLHRVHHGANEPYLDRNFGATLILWDRLFGTYQKEGAAGADGVIPVVFGTVTPFAGHNPVKANAYFWGVLWRAPWRAWLKPPAGL